MIRPTVARPLAAALAAALVLSGCAREIGADKTVAGAVGETIRTERGTVRAARIVTVEEADRLQENETGGLIGGVAGGAAGARFGGGWGKVASIAAGALIGYTAGAFAEQELSRQEAIEYVVELDDGQLYTVVQGGEDALEPGEEVFVQFQRGESRARIIRA